MSASSQPNRTESIICLRPFYALDLNLYGKVTVCCPAWGKVVVGDVHKKTLLEIWNDEPIRYVRKMMLSGNWQKICRSSCPFIAAHRFRGAKIELAFAESHLISRQLVGEVMAGKDVLESRPAFLNFANSKTCNLDCIMCGGRYTRDDRDSLQKTLVELDVLLPSLREIFLAGHGDLFARQETRDFLCTFQTDRYPAVRFNILTNGLLLPRYWERLNHINFGYMDISVDAACRETYEKIRKGGSWGELLEALRLVQANRERFVYVHLNMTVMRSNYREIAKFVELAGSFGFSVGISKIRGKWGEENVFTHLDHSLACELADLIREGDEKALQLGISFDHTEFNDLLSGHVPAWSEQLPQRLFDLASHYGLLARYYFGKKG